MVMSFVVVMSFAVVLSFAVAQALPFPLWAFLALSPRVRPHLLSVAQKAHQVALAAWQAFLLIATQCL